MKLLATALINAICLALLHLHTESTQPPFSCDSANPQTKLFPFCQTKLPIRKRVQDLVSHLTLDEKISQLVNSAPAIPRLGVPPYEWWSEALHGVSGYGYGVTFNGRISSVTSFPQVLLTAATFDSHLWYRIGQAIGKEARAVYNAGQAKGMTFWAPNINIFRDPRWGRGQETPGEDPLVVGNYAVAYVRGVQGDSFQGGKLNNGHLQASACCKHFTAYDLDNWNGFIRFGFNAQVTKQDLADTYQPPFRSCVKDGRASGIMCAYNSVNGVPNCADYNLLTKTARGEWGGKLPVTWYPKDFTRVPMTDMRMRPEPSSGYPGRTYRFYNGKKVFEFGYGLSYSTYTYEFVSSTPNTLHLNLLLNSRTKTESSSSLHSLSVSDMGTETCEKAKFSALVGVENSGEVAGKHPVLLFARHDRPSNQSPLKQLVGFQSVSLNSGERTEVEFEISPCEHLSTATEDGLMVIEEGYRYLMLEDKEYLINIVI
ncbi:probable beta-D-xylosidase 7 [Olea europaea subsp. europaea]|uniref:Probable beta-D-xylosidase 7 n=1 Tax=Olea europaea subsp. europaea TaxID=158383 RepID=A0A8S0SS33_OLEEU|nr:probable beta-D-xylosidase 7 [Olea europaea subsp. europaea]